MILIRSSQKQQQQMGEVESFGWGDFPVVTAAPAIPFSPSYGCQRRSFPSAAPRCFAGDESLACVSPSEDESDESVASSTEGMSVESITRTPRRKNDGRRVGFATVEVQEYGLALGDHPWATEYPLTLDWRHSSSIQYAVDEFEEHYRKNGASHHQPGNSVPRRLSPMERRRRLAMINDISTAELDTAEVQRRRVQEEQERLRFLAVLCSATATAARHGQSWAQSDPFVGRGDIFEPTLSYNPLSKRPSGLLSNLIQG